MPEEALLPVTVTRGPAEITVEMDPEDIIKFKQGDQKVTRVNLTLAGENVAIMQKLGGSTLPASLPDMTEEEISGFVEALEEVRGENGLRARIEAALNTSIDRCARCKVCSNQVDAVMAVLGYPPENAN